MPETDQSQDYKLIGGSRNDTHTVIRFWRLWDTCDKDNDMLITADTMRLIWAYHESDPDNGVPQYHGTKRGTKSILMREPPKEKLPLGDDIKVWEVRGNNHKLPSDRATYYGCQIEKVPFFDKKHQMIGVSYISNAIQALMTQN